ncbi:hypothetical protein MtrunA17_Chr1g0184351 [Medicago truncatula]|uniref:Uncharacterized protein n=1 Tax=Medicago truncatula TaxID=3880 RepID=A0A396JP69_MEDTR|nr:hypothetical protein MtrunA17_Chr1g0184351 [Medicago truncatula]
MNNLANVSIKDLQPQQYSERITCKLRSLNKLEKLNYGNLII